MTNFSAGLLLDSRCSQSDYLRCYNSGYIVPLVDAVTRDGRKKSGRHMTYWNIDSAHGNSISQGIQLESEARKAAQRTANRLGESVYLYEAGADGESEAASEEIEPVSDEEGRTFRVKYSNGAERGPFASLQRAKDNVTESYPDAEIGHDGDIADGGDRTLCWASEDDSVDDDGAKAVASIWASK